MKNKGSIIIYEGPDGIGKSSFITYETVVRNKKNVSTYEYSGAFDNSTASWIIEMLKWVNDANNGKTVLISRCWLSEKIYSPVFNRKSRLTSTGISRLTTYMRMLTKANGIDLRILILMPRDKQSVYTRLKQRGDDDKVLQNWPYLVKEYEQLIELNRSRLKAVYI